MKKIIAFLFLVMCVSGNVLAQTKHEPVSDSLYNVLWDFLINEEVKKYKVNQRPNKGLITKEELSELYADRTIYSVNLKNDSADVGQTVGLYKFRFSGLDQKPWLYMRYDDRMEFIDINSRNFNLEKFVDRIFLLFKTYPGRFTLEQQVNTLKGAMDAVVQNRFVNQYQL